jgi:hypothetical protein
MHLLENLGVKIVLGWRSDARTGTHIAANDNRHMDVFWRGGDDIGWDTRDVDALGLILVACWDNL